MALNLLAHLPPPGKVYGKVWGVEKSLRDAVSTSPQKEQRLPLLSTRDSFPFRTFFKKTKGWWSESNSKGTCLASVKS
jgi:hypothetical protein